jgi:prolyl oligopeptidase
MKKLFLFFLPLVFNAQKAYEYPVAEKSDVNDEYFGTTITDPFRYLEDANSPKTVAWLEEEAKFCAKYSKKISLTDGIYAKLLKYSYIDFKPLTKRGKYYFTFKNDEEGEAPSLYYQENLNDEKSKLIVSVDNFKTNKSDIISIHDFDVSGDNKFLSVTLSNHGSDWSTIRVISIDREKPLNDKIENVKFANVSWRGNGFFYVKCDSVSKEERMSASNKNPKLYYHKLGTDPKSDKLYYTSSNSSDLWFTFKITADENYLIIKDIIKQDNKEVRAVLYARLDSFPALQLKPFITSTSKKASYAVVDNIDTKFLVVSNEDAPTKKLLLCDPSALNQYTELVKPVKNILMHASYAKNKILCLYYLDGAYTAKVFDVTGKVLKTINFPPGCSVRGFSASYYETETLYYLHSFYFPTVVYKFNIDNLIEEPVSKTGIAYNYKLYETKFVKFRSADSTEIPMYITYKKGIKLDGNNPTLLYGYGGFGISVTPFFSTSNIVWMENGGVLAVPSLRGGGEQGTQWHDEGRKLKKMNVFNDFISAAQYLIDNKYTNSEKLAISGASNGGLLVGAAMTQRPDLFKVAIPQVGVLDMLRYHKFTIASQWVSEYGVSSNSVDFPNLKTYSPLHNIKSGVKYPATLIITADGDDRVMPFHSYKFAAALQANGDNSSPYILKVIKKAGHSGSSIITERLETEALKLGFIFKNMKIDAPSIYLE